MVRLRLRRTGTRNKACFRIVAADKKKPRDGRFIEVLGYYDPRHDDEQINLERADYWLEHGAQPSETVAQIIKRARGDAPALKPSVPTPGKKSAPEAPAKEEAKAEEAKAEEAKAEEAPAEEAKAEEAKAEEAKAEDTDAADEAKEDK